MSNCGIIIRSNTHSRVNFAHSTARQNAKFERADNRETAHSFSTHAIRIPNSAAANTLYYLKQKRLTVECVNVKSVCLPEYTICSLFSSRCFSAFAPRMQDFVNKALFDPPLPLPRTCPTSTEIIEICKWNCGAPRTRLNKRAYIVPKRVEPSLNEFRARPRLEVLTAIHSRARFRRWHVDSARPHFQRNNPPLRQTRVY